jgi:hypothetical protein
LWWPLGREKENAPIAGAPPDAKVVYGTHVYQNGNGEFTVGMTPYIWRPNEYYITYVSGKLKGQRFYITEERYNQYDEEGKRRWGYMKFNYRDWQWEFVPGTERKSLPLVSPWTVTHPDINGGT